MTSHSKIIASGSALPSLVLSNHDLAKKMDTSHEWISSRTGIHQRHVVSGSECTLSLAADALLDASSKDDVPLSSIDAVIVATMTPQQTMPSTACLVQQKLNLNPGLAFDINAACSGFVYAFNIADSLIKANAAHTVAVIGVDVMSKIINWQDRNTAVLFGDGAGAVILSQSDEPGVLGTFSQANGHFADLLHANGGLYQPLDAQGKLKMDGREVFKNAVKTLESLVVDSLQQVGIAQNQVSWLIPHQANLRIINATAKLLKLPPEKVIVTIGEHANTSAASIPLALDFALSTKKIKPGEIALLEAFGAGFTWGSSIVKF